MYYTVIKHSGHLRTLEPAARVFYIFFVFSNARRVLSQCNTRLTLLYLLSEVFRQGGGSGIAAVSGSFAKDRFTNGGVGVSCL